jgi:hypothetical protein
MLYRSAGLKSDRLLESLGGDSEWKKKNIYD